MALNCIVDDSALLSGLEENGKNDLAKWVRDGSISLFVPLYTLEQLNQSRGSPPPLNIKARKTLEWLDNITSATNDGVAGRVELQGPDDQYPTWREVEKYLLPDTPLSSSGLDIVEGLREDIRGRLTLNGSRHGATALRDASESGRSLSSSSSPDRLHNSAGSGRSGNHSRNASQVSIKSQANTKASDGNAGITQSVRPLLNYVVWRTYNAGDGVARTGKYILLTNDRNTQKLAQKFGVRAKLLTQVASIVSKSSLSGKANGIASDVPHVGDVLDPEELAQNGHEGDLVEEDDDDEEILFKPTMRPTSSQGKPSPSNVMDPNHFGRRGGQPATPIQSPKRGYATPAVRPTSRGGPAGQLTGAPGRGQSGSQRGRGNFSPRGTNGGAAAARGGPQSRGQARPQANAKPIDPDSYVRPAPFVSRGRGNQRRLFDPNS